MKHVANLCALPLIMLSLAISFMADTFISIVCWPPQFASIQFDLRSFLFISCIIIFPHSTVIVVTHIIFSAATDLYEKSKQTNDLVKCQRRAMAANSASLAAAAAALVIY